MEQNSEDDNKETLIEDLKSRQKLEVEKLDMEREEIKLKREILTDYNKRYQNLI